MTIPNRQPRSDPVQLIAYLVRDTAILDGHATHVALFYLPELGPILSCSSVVRVENNSGHMTTLAENRRLAYPGCADYTLQVHVHVAIAVHEGAVVCVAILELQQLRPQRHTTHKADLSVNTQPGKAPAQPRAVARTIGLSTAARSNDSGNCKHGEPSRPPHPQHNQPRTGTLCQCHHEMWTTNRATPAIRSTIMCIIRISPHVPSSKLRPDLPSSTPHRGSSFGRKQNRCGAQAEM